MEKNMKASDIKKLLERGSHPEIREGEIYIGNVDIVTFNEHMEWKTKRLGETAYDTSGNAIKTSAKLRLRPAFVSRKEYCGN